jgi:hypothetical protein
MQKPVTGLMQVDGEVERATSALPLTANLENHGSLLPIGLLAWQANP